MPQNGPAQLPLWSENRRSFNTGIVILVRRVICPYTLGQVNKSRKGSVSMFKWGKSATDSTAQTKTAPDDPAEIIRQTEIRYPMPRGEIERLNARRWILNHVPAGGVGVEVGVFRGHFSALICKSLRPRKLYLIDPWTKIGATFGWGKEYTNFDTLTTEVARNEAVARVAQFPETEVVIIEDIYPTCSAQITEALDFAYLDASHKYKPTLNELIHLNDQMAPGGVIMGDDWAPDPNHQHHGVFLAIQEFTRKSDWDIIAAGPGAQWAIKRRSVAAPVAG